MKTEPLHSIDLKKPRKNKNIRLGSKAPKLNSGNHDSKIMPSILMLTTYPPRECGIATYSKDLIQSLQQVFGDSFSLKICPLYDKKNPLPNSKAYTYSLDTGNDADYLDLSSRINADQTIEIVMIQHEFGLYNGCDDVFLEFLKNLEKPLLLGFHTVIPKPDRKFLKHVQAIASFAKGMVVMTETSKDILVKEYRIHPSKINVINHGTHLVRHKSRAKLKTKYHLNGKTVLSTFGLLGPGKNIETTLDALPGIVKDFPDVVFLVLGKTHPNLVKHEGESYRNLLLEKVKALHLEAHVKFINEFLPLKKLLEYLQLTDIYLFTSKDPNQAVSGTFAYAMSCGCPILSTPIPHAREFLSENKGLMFDFEDSNMLSNQLRILLKDKKYRKNLGLNGLHASSATSWQNSALAHGHLFNKLSQNITLKYRKPEIKLDHLRKMTTSLGMIQFSKLNQPDIKSGYTLDDNARALIVICEAYRLTRDYDLLEYLIIYSCFIMKCQRSDGAFLNYIDEKGQFTNENEKVNLEDSNGRALWAIGNLIAMEDMVPEKYGYIFERAKDCFQDFMPHIVKIHSPRAMAFIIKGMKASNLVEPKSPYYHLVLQLGLRLINMYKHESQNHWKWFESYLTYGNSVLPEAVLDVYSMTKIEEFKVIAFTSFNFLLRLLFNCDQFKVISNEKWFLKGDSIKDSSCGGQQPIDVAYTVLALKNFHEVFPLEKYEEKMDLAFSWFMGNNHLRQIVYNPCTTGCFDGLETTYINLNQGAESTISYLLARLAFEGFE